MKNSFHLSIINFKYFNFSLWLSPACPKLDNPLDIVKGESPTGFKRSLLNYLNSYALPCLSPFVEAVKQADFSDIK